MGFDVQARLEELNAKRLNLARLESDLARLRQQHREAAGSFAREQGRAALDRGAGAPLPKSAELRALEADLARSEDALPHIRAALVEDLRLFRAGAAAALREKHAAAVADARARLEQAYDEVAAAIARLAGVIGENSGRGILAGGEHVQPIRERLQRAALPEAGLLQQAEHIAYTLRNLLEGKPEAAVAAARANPELFVVAPAHWETSEGSKEVPSPLAPKDRRKPRAARTHSVGVQDRE